ncbi:MAG TPA: hypothetical protein VG961_02930 [Ignavibacteria bacterium]|nr:hypothetical protein [Ignavibacteria bacterium]
MNELNTNIKTKAEEEISVIKQLMEDSRKAVVENGWHYIYWGSIVTAAIIVNYLMIVYNVSMYAQGMLWFFSMPGAAIIEGIIERKLKKHEKVKTFAGKLINSLWTGAGVCMFILGFAGSLSGAYSAVTIFPLISIVLGAAYFISGVIQQVKWLSALSVFWWSGAVVLLLLPGMHSMLIFAGMLVCFQIVPGVLLFINSKKELKQLAV